MRRWESGRERGMGLGERGQGVKGQGAKGVGDMGRT